MQLIKHSIVWLIKLSKQPIDVSNRLNAILTHIYTGSDELH